MSFCKICNCEKEKYCNFDIQICKTGGWSWPFSSPFRFKNGRHWQIIMAVLGRAASCQIFLGIFAWGILMGNQSPSSNNHSFPLIMNLFQKAFIVLIWLGNFLQMPFKHANMSRESFVLQDIILSALVCAHSKSVPYAQVGVSTQIPYCLTWNAKLTKFEQAVVADMVNTYLQKSHTSWSFWRHPSGCKLPAFGWISNPAKPCWVTTGKTSFIIDDQAHHSLHTILMHGGQAN